MLSNYSATYKESLLLRSHSEQVFRTLECSYTYGLGAAFVHRNGNETGGSCFSCYILFICSVHS